VHRAFQAILQPTARQAKALERLLAAQRELYNAALEERIGAWRWERRSVTRFEQFRNLTGWDHPALDFGVCPARGTLTRLDRAFGAFYRRCRIGETPGFPRFKSDARWNSVEYPDVLCWRVVDQHDGVGRLHVQGVGDVRFRGTRRGIPGTAKTLTIRREGGRWRITVFCTDCEAEPLPPSHAAVGVDVGVTELVATSDGELYGNQRHLRRSLGGLADRQRIAAGRQRGSNRRRKAARQIGRMHRRIAHQRRDLAHQISRQLVNRYGTIVHEDLQIRNLVRRPKPRSNEEGVFQPNGAAAKGGLNREILAAGWGQLLRYIGYKAEEAGRQVIAVDPRHTSQTCHHCGQVDPANRTAAHFRRTGCGHVDHADVNAARNILRAGQALRHEREAEGQSREHARFGP
jgi:putative transposase